VSFLLSLSLPLGALLNGEACPRAPGAGHADAGRSQTPGWSEEEAYLHIRRLSRQQRTPMREIAREVIGYAG